MIKQLAATSLVAIIFAGACQSTTDTGATDIAEDVEKEDAIYSAMGQEPGWRLDIFADTFTLDYAYGEKSVSGDLPDAEYTDGTTHYFAFPDSNNDGNMVEIIISDEYCADIMSGRPFPDKVVVMVNDEMLQGCGGETATLLTANDWTVTSLNGAALAPDTISNVFFQRRQSDFWKRRVQSLWRRL